MNVMLDLETLGTAPGCAVLSVGAVPFDVENGVREDWAFYAEISLVSCLAAGLTIDPQTLAWWLKQPDRGVLERASAAPLHPKMPLAPYPWHTLGLGSLTDMAQAFSQWWSMVASEDDLVAMVWGNGADFDLPIWAHAMRAVKWAQPWKPFNGRCYRTLKNLRPDVRPEAGAVAHHALADATRQAEHAVRLLRAVGL